MNTLFIKEILLENEVCDGTYIDSLPIVKALNREKIIKIKTPVTFFVGENGTGKSTLMEAIAVSAGFNAEGGSRNFKFSTNSTESNLHKYLTLGSSGYPNDGFFLRAESYYNVASYIDEIDQQIAASPKVIESYGGKSLHVQSHGESFMALVQNRFGRGGLYILDEPEAALSPQKQLTLLCDINSLVNDGCQFIISTHSPILMACPDSTVYYLENEEIIEKPYTETAHFKTAKLFMDNPERMLKMMLSK